MTYEPIPWEELPKEVKEAIAKRNTPWRRLQRAVKNIRHQETLDTGYRVHPNSKGIRARDDKRIAVGTAGERRVAQEVLKKLGKKS